MRLLVISVILLAGCASPADEPTREAAEAAEPPVHEVAWRTDAVGSAGHAFEVRPVAATECRVVTAAIGHAVTGGATLAFIVDNGERDVDVDGGPDTLLTPDARAQVAGESVRTVAGDAWSWDTNRTFAAQPEQPLYVALVAMHLDGIAPRDRVEGLALDDSAALRVTCEAPIAVRAWQASDVQVFSERSFSGGAGTHVKGLGQTGVQVANHVQIATDAPQGEVHVRIAGDLLLQRAAGGIVQVTTPDEEALLLDHPATIPMALAGMHTFEHHFTAGPGTYRLDVHYASVDITGDIRGFMAGWQPV